MYGTSLKKRRLFVCGRSGGEPQIHEFDLVSEDRKIVGEIKSGKCSTTNCSLALVDCFYLSRLKARVRLMIFTDKEL